MSAPNSIRKGTRGGGDSRAQDLFSSMGQGSITDKKLTRGLFAQMGQGAAGGAPKLRPGKSAPSIARAMGQGGK